MNYLIVNKIKMSLVADEKHLNTQQKHLNDVNTEKRYLSNYNI